MLLILALDNDVIVGDPLIFRLFLSTTTDQIIKKTIDLSEKNIHIAFYLLY